MARMFNFDVTVEVLLSLTIFGVSCGFLCLFFFFLLALGLSRLPLRSLLTLALLLSLRFPLFLLL